MIHQSKITINQEIRQSQRVANLEQYAPFSAFFGSLFVFSPQQFWTPVGLAVRSINNASKHICTMRVYSSASSSLESLPASPQAYMLHHITGK